MTNDKEVSAKLTNGQWDVTIKADGWPLTLRDVNLLRRAVLVATKAHLKQWNLKQRALQRKTEEAAKPAPKPTSTGQKELTNV